MPAALCVLLIIVGVKEPDSIKESSQRGWPVQKADLLRLPASYWTVVAIGVVFTLARFSGAFLVLKAQHAIRSDWAAESPLVRSSCSGGGRSRAGVGAGAAGCVSWYRTLGPLSRANTRPAFGLCRRYCAGRHARYGLWRFQSAHRDGAAHRQPPCWLWSIIGPKATFLAGAAFAGLAATVMVSRWRSIGLITDTQPVEETREDYLAGEKDENNQTDIGKRKS